MATLWRTEFRKTNSDAGTLVRKHLQLFRSEKKVTWTRVVAMEKERRDWSPFRAGRFHFVIVC